MDATRAPVAAPTVFRDLTCGVCGYLRTGLPPTARCPECGSPPPTPIAPLLSATGVAKDRAQQAWLFSVTVGLITLIVCSYFALQSELFINNGGLTLVIINAPAPKLTAGGCLLREMGNPAEWGVQGFLATLGTLLGVWFITEPAASRGDESFFALRWMTRCCAVLTFGAQFGGLLCGYEINNQWWGWWTLPSMLASIGLVELPTNTLLYLYLAKLSKRFDPSPEPRPLFALNIAAWLNGATCLSGVILSAMRAQAQDQPVEMWRWLQCGYGVLAISSGLIMTLGVLRLTARMIGATLDASVLTLPGAIRSLSMPIVRLADVVRSDPKRFAAIAGLVLWMYFTRPLITLSAMLEHRQGLGGDLPALNFIGPKIAAVALLDITDWGRVDVRLSVLMTLASLWLITMYRPSKQGPSAWLVRWLPTAVMGAAIGFLITVSQVLDQFRQSHWNAAAIIFIEAPGTLLAYLYLANMAEAIRQTSLARQLRLIAFVASVIIVWPLGYMVFSREMRHHQGMVIVLVAGIWYGTLVVASSVMAWALFVRLTWALLTMKPETAKEETVDQRSADASREASIALKNSGVGVL